MDPTRLALVSTGTGLLLAALVLGPLTIVSLVNYDAPDEPMMREGSMSAPAAQQAFTQGLKSDHPAYLNERMEMTMQMIGPDDVILAEAVVRADPETGDHQFHLVFELKAMQEAYGDDSQQDDNIIEDDGFGWMFGIDDEEELERFEISFASVGQRHAMAFGPSMGWQWRDHGPNDDFTLFGDNENDAPGDDPTDLDLGLGGDELARFIEADDSIAVHQVEESEWQGTPSWKITTTITEDGLEEEAVFHFRQSDMAPLALDLHMSGADEDGFFAILQDEETDMDLSHLEDFEIHMKMRFTYGGDFEFEFPEDLPRKAVSPQTTNEYGPGLIARTLTAEQNTLVPLEELEIHVVIVEEPQGMFFDLFDETPQDPDDEAAMMMDLWAGPTVVETLAVLPLKDALETEDNSYTIVYEDNDGDGYLTPGDRFHVAHSQEGIWTNETHRVELLIYDTWAEEYEGAPAPAILLVIAVLMGAAGLVRGHRRATK